MRSKHLWTLAALAAAVMLLPCIAQATVRTITLPDLCDPVKQALLGGTDTLITEGVATARYCSGGGCGFYIEDFGLSAQYRGVLVFTGGGMAFTDSGGVIGDRIRVKARWTEYNGETEMVSLSGSSFGTPPWIQPLFTNPGIPGPTTVTTGDIAERGVTGEWYEGMFCRLNKSVKCVNTRNLGAYNLAQCVNADGTAPGDTILIDTATIPLPAITRPDSGVVITFLQGIVGQRGVPSGIQLRGYRLRIRDGADITFPAPPSVIDIYAVANDTIRVVFDKALDPLTSQDPTKYSRATLKAVDSAILQPDPVTGIQQYVALVTAVEPQVPAEAESVTVQGVKSALGMVMPSPQGRRFLAGLIPIAQMQTALPGKAYSGPEGSDTSQYVGKICSVRGTVTLRDGTLVWIQDPAGGLRSGFKLYSPVSAMTDGDDVTVVGLPLEYFDETEFSTAIFERINGAGATPPYMDVAANKIRALNEFTPSTMSWAREDVEHILVRVSGVAVKATGSCYGNYSVKQGGPCFRDPNCADTVGASSRVDNRYAPWYPWTGKQFTTFGGPTEVSNPAGQCFNALRIVPRDTTADIVSGPVTGAPAAPLRFALRVAGPNPVAFGHGGTQFAITLPEKGAPTLALYDLRGRLVKTLTAGTEMEAGPYNVRWDGADAAGRQVQSGIYFAQLRLGDRVAGTKLVVAN